MRLKLFYFKKPKKKKKKDGAGVGREVGVVIKAQQEGRILVMMEMFQILHISMSIMWL